MRTVPPAVATVLAPVLGAVLATVLVTGLVTACGADQSAAPATSATSVTHAPTRTATIPGAPVTFAAADGTSLTGRVTGSGTSAVVLSNMGDNDRAEWEHLTPVLAARGYTVLTYTYRYPARSRSLTPAMARGAVDDLTGAVAFVRSRGARRVVLIGASLGGMVTAKMAGVLRVDTVAILAAPGDRRDFDLRVEPRELAAITAPKLFVASDRDPTVDAADTRRLYDGSPEPKRWQVYAGTAHGTQLFGTALGGDLITLLVEFVTSTAPA